LKVQEGDFIIWLDYETTGLSPRLHKPIELAYSILRRGANGIFPVFLAGGGGFIKPAKISKKIRKITNITQKQIDKAGKSHKYRINGLVADVRTVARLAGVSMTAARFFLAGFNINKVLYFPSSQFAVNTTTDTGPLALYTDIVSEPLTSPSQSIFSLSLTLCG
jgi:hypothetical protein